MIRVDDRRNDVAAKSGADLIKQVFVRLIVLLVLKIADLKVRTVGRQAAGQRRRYARTQIAADNRSAHQANLRLLLLKEVYKNIRVGL